MAENCDEKKYFFYKWGEWGQETTSLAKLTAIICIGLDRHKNLGDKLTYRAAAM